MQTGRRLRARSFRMLRGIFPVIPDNMRNNTKQPRDLAKSLIDSAKEQLDDFELLYSNKRYPSAVLAIQRVIELIGKAEYCLSCNTTSIIDLGHEYQKIIPSLNKTIGKIYQNNEDEKNARFYQSVQYLQATSKLVQEKIKRAKDLIDIENVDYDTFYNFYNKLKSGSLPNGDKVLKIDKLFSIEKTEDEFRVIIDDIQQIIDELDKTYDINIISPSDEEICMFCNFTRIGVPRRMREVRLDSPYGRKIIKDFRDGTFSNITSIGLYYHYQRYINTATHLSPILTDLNLLVQGHKLAATYPDTEHFPTKAPSEIYTSEHTLVKHLPEIKQFTSSALEYVQDNLESLEVIDGVRAQQVKQNKRNLKKMRRG